MIFTPSEFQFTLPRGERQVSPRYISQYLRGFNSRSREGSDFANSRSERAGNVSIHAPARGATEDSPLILPLEGFNSRSREGSDA